MREWFLVVKYKLTSFSSSSTTLAYVVVVNTVILKIISNKVLQKVCVLFFFRPQRHFYAFRQSVVAGKTELRLLLITFSLTYPVSVINRKWPKPVNINDLKIYKGDYWKRTTRFWIAVTTPTLRTASRMKQCCRSIWAIWPTFFFTICKSELGTNEQTNLLNCGNLRVFGLNNLIVDLKFVHN